MAPYATDSPSEFSGWRLRDIDALPLLEVHPQGWTLVQLEPRPQSEQLPAWARGAEAIFLHVAQLGGRLALARVIATDNVAVHDEFFIATYLRYDGQ